MTRRMASWQKTLALLALGGCAFHYPFLTCSAQNRNIIDLYQAVGNESIAAFSDAVINDNTANSDYDLIIRQPVTNYFQALWSNWIWESFPRDPAFVNVAVE